MHLQNTHTISQYTQSQIAMNEGCLGLSSAWIENNYYKSHVLTKHKNIIWNKNTTKSHMLTKPQGGHDTTRS